jgi:hypothetical protein
MTRSKPGLELISGYSPRSSHKQAKTLKVRALFDACQIHRFQAAALVENLEADALAFRKTGHAGTFNVVALNHLTVPVGIEGPFRIDYQRTHNVRAAVAGYRNDWGSRSQVAETYKHKSRN